MVFGMFQSEKKQKESLEDRYARIRAEVAADTPLGFDVAQGEADLYDLLNPMLFVGSLIYTLSYLRKLARTKELALEELIISPEANVKESERHRKAAFEGRLTKDRIEARDVIRFVEANLGDLGDDDEINCDFSVYALLSLAKPTEAYVCSFDDDFQKKDIVYGTTVNRDHKRITVVFRGSVTKNNWVHNAQATHSKMETPAFLLEKGFPADKNLTIHKGFKTYLFKDQEPPYGTDQKYNVIKQDILDLYEKGGCEGYDLFVTGHSLGGALSTLVAFELAASRKLAQHLNGKPVVNISFASPYVGGAVWNEAFQLLEREGRCQHVRVSNQKDLVPTMPPLPDYEHVGLNLYLDPDEDAGYQLDYRGNRSMFGQWSFGAVERHGLEDHYVRKTAVTDHFAGKKLAEVYGDESVTRGFQDPVDKSSSSSPLCI